MAQPYFLRHDVRERVTPQVSAYGLAEYIIADPNRQETVLHDQRFQGKNVAPKHKAVRDAVEAYCTDIKRSPEKLMAVRKALIAKSESDGFDPGQRDEAARCVEGIDLFWNARQAFGADGLSLFAVPRLPAFDINGTTISLQPDLIVGSPYPPENGQKFGVVLLRPQKSPDPESFQREETKAKKKEYRLEAARYLLVIAAMMFRNTGVPKSQLDLAKFMVWDLRLKEAVGFPSDWVSREKQVSAAAGQIARLWPTVPPKANDLAKG